MNDANEACSAAQINKVVEFAASYADNMINLLGAASCAGVKEGETTLPSAVGDSIDLLAAITARVSISGLTITTATLERLADSGSYAVYLMTLIGSQTFGIETYPITVYLKHIPTTSDGTTYKGIIAYKMDNDSGTRPGNCNDFPATETGSVFAGSIHYEKISATDFKYELNTGEFCGATTNPFTDYEISPNDVISASNLDGWANSYNLVFSM